MPNTSPLPLVNHKRYIGLKQWFYIKSKEKTASETFNFVVGTITNWVNRKTGRKDSSQLKLFESKSIDNGYYVNVKYHEKSGAWAMEIKEADLAGTVERERIIGRYFLTEVAVKLTDDNVILQYTITLLDPPDVPQLDYAFRPAFVRSFVENESLILYQIGEDIPISNRALKVDCDEAYEKVKKLYESGLNTLPLVIIPEIDKITYNAEEFAKHIFGYAHVVTANDDYMKKLKVLCGFDNYVQGNIFRVSPKCARKLSPIEVFSGESDEEIAEILRIEEVNGRTDAYGRAPDSVRQWHKFKPMPDAQVMFLKQVEKALHNDEIAKFKENQNYKGAYEEAQKELELYKKENEEQKTELDELRAEGTEELWAEIERLEAEIKKDKETIRGLKETKDGLEKELDAYKEKARIEKEKAEAESRKPKKKDEIAAWVEQEFAGKLILHDKAKDKLLKATVESDKLENICDALEYLATVYRDWLLKEITEDERNNIASEKYGRPFDVRLCGENNIRQFKEYRIKYYPGYNGKPVESDLDMHLRIGTGPETTVAIYFLYDNDKKLIVVGSLPDHLSISSQVH